MDHLAQQVLLELLGLKDSMVYLESREKMEILA